MTYETPQALRMALEQRLLNESGESGISIDRLRRRVIFERIVARLHVADPGRWVLKGGMALEVRLRDDARLTKDIDLGLRAEVDDEEELHDDLSDALNADPYGDQFHFAPGPVARLMADGAGHLTWRSKVSAHLAGKLFGSVQLDISPRAHELDQTESMDLPNSLSFAGIESPSIEIIDVNRHAAEKLHAMSRQFGERENSRVRDLVDLALLVEHELLTPTALGSAARQVWFEREGEDPPAAFPELPSGWPDRYEAIAAEHDLAISSFPEAATLVADLWADLFPTEET